MCHLGKLGLSSAAAALMLAGAGDPVSVELSGPANDLDGAGVLVELKNQSPKAVKAVGLLVEYPDEHGRSSLRREITMVWGLKPADPVQSRKPGESWRHRLPAVRRTSDGLPASCRVTVDYVLFDDATTWGPDTAKLSKRIRGFQAGFEAALATTGAKP